jgi:hypothetical protein
MDLVARNRLGITRLLAAAEQRLPADALLFFEGILAEPELLQSGRFCSPGPLADLPTLILIDAERRSWQARIGGLSVSCTPSELLDLLRREPIWFLAIQGAPLEPLEPDPLVADRAARLLDSLQNERVRRIALLDQIDAALDAGDRESYDRLQRLLQELSPLS